VTAQDDNKRVVQAYVAAFNAGDIEALRALFTPDAVIYGVLGGGPFDVAAAIWRELHAAFGLTLEVVDLVAEGDVVAARYLDRGTSRGPFRGQEPTGKSYETVAMEWFVFRDGKIHRRWGARDSAAQARQMGLKAL
jgi:steroid delta-isomerase-like uncharacterized protein